MYSKRNKYQGMRVKYRRILQRELLLKRNWFQILEEFAFLKMAVLNGGVYSKSEMTLSENNFTRQHLPRYP